MASRCKEVESGARNVDQILTGTLLPELAQKVLERMAEGMAITRVEVRVSESDGGFEYTVE